MPDEESAGQIGQPESPPRGCDSVFVEIDGPFDLEGLYEIQSYDHEHVYLGKFEEGQGIVEEISVSWRQFAKRFATEEIELRAIR